MHSRCRDQNEAAFPARSSCCADSLRRQSWPGRPLRVSCEIPEKLILRRSHLKTLKVFFFTSVFISTTAFGQSFTLEQVMSSPFPTQLTSASHASIVAWVFNNKGSDNVWIASGANHAGRQLTPYSGGDGQRIASVKLAPRGHTIIHARLGAERRRAFCEPVESSRTTKAASV